MQAETSSLSLREQLASQPPLTWFSILFLGGIVLGSLFSVPLWIWLGFVALFIIIAILSPRLIRIPPFYFLLVAGLFFGAFRYQASIPKFDAFHIAFYNDREYDLLITGTIDELPDYRDTYTNLRVRVNAVDTTDGDLPVDGLILVRAQNNEHYEYGQQIRLRGRLKTPPENEEFSFRDYLAAQHIHSYMTSPDITTLPGYGGNPLLRVLYAFKERSLDNIYRLFPDPESSLMAGILLGVDTGLTTELQQAFKDTGTAHIIAISGFNISIIAAIFVTYFSRWLGERRGAILAVTAIALYTVFVGGDAAVVRAAVMGGLALFAKQLGRRQIAMNTLLFVALAMCMWNPLYVWDVGFQLSFFATLGLILYATPFSEFANRIITRYFPTPTGERFAQLFSEFVLLTLAAQVTTLPIMAYHFQRISLISFIANPFILPVQPAVMILGGIAVLLSLVWLPLGQIAAWVAWPFVVYTIRVVELFGRVPDGTIQLGSLSIWFVLIFFIALFAVTFGWSDVKEWIRSLRQRAAVVGVGSVIVVLTIGLLLVWRAVASAPDGYMHVTIMNVGSADGILIQTPSGKNILINGGQSVTELSDDLGRRISSFDRELDWLIVASTEEEQVAALPRVLERYPPGAVLWSGNRQASYSARVLNEYLSIKGISVIDAEKDQVLELGDGATLTVMTTGPSGAVLLLEYQNFRAVFPVGMSFDALDELAYGEDVGPVSMLSLADSGYYAANPDEWIANLNPELIVLSVDAANPFGRPDADTLFLVRNYTFLRTDQNGWIEVTTDGLQLWVDVER